MTHSLSSLMAAGVAWMSFVSMLRADSPASIEIVGVKLTGKNQVTVETEVRNLSNENIQIDPSLTFRMANLKGEYYDKSWEDPIKPGIYMAGLILYDDLTTVLPNGSPAFLKLNMRVSKNGLNPPLVLLPGERKKIFLAIPDMDQMLQKDLVMALSKDVWMRAGLYQSGENDKKYSPMEFTHGNLYKLEKPKEGESGIGLEILKAPF